MRHSVRAAVRTYNGAASGEVRPAPHFESPGVVPLEERLSAKITDVRDTRRARVRKDGAAKTCLIKEAEPARALGKRPVRTAIRIEGINRPAVHVELVVAASAVHRRITRASGPDMTRPIIRDARVAARLSKRAYFAAGAAKSLQTHFFNRRRDDVLLIYRIAPAGDEPE